ncbi:hypothetical protein HH310_19460 [Actinoplanes sp. TBRC 11911]|uniref:hypothetical protein n=1 Tax=Actinoplanes sp. TBRC 11911 TaxID=2729386 RepID=UPI00145E6EED|nr:hypothetical protein [Actinoplanes sp. TBRC 11911]NMO53357.1 hypothetical protein [Actinoplanes sp. TBRC 11911]
MYVGPSATGVATGLRLSLVHHSTFTGKLPYDEYNAPYYSDLWRLFGLPWKDEFLAGGRWCFDDMIDVLTGRFGSLFDDLDMAVLAHAVPDAEPRYAMPRMAETSGGIDTVFGVSDQGATAGFTALRLAGTTMPRGRHGRVLVVVMDQAAAIPGLDVPAAVRAEHDSAVLMLLDTAGTLGTPRVRQRAAPTPDQIVAHLRAEAEAAAAGAIVCGAELQPFWEATGLSADVIEPVAGMPGTGHWAALAGVVESTSGPVVVADYRAGSGYLSTCAFHA